MDPDKVNALLDRIDIVRHCRDTMLTHLLAPGAHERVTALRLAVKRLGNHLQNRVARDMQCNVARFAQLYSLYVVRALHRLVRGCNEVALGTPGDHARLWWLAVATARCIENIVHMYRREGVAPTLVLCNDALVRNHAAHMAAWRSAFAGTAVLCCGAADASAVNIVRAAERGVLCERQPGCTAWKLIAGAPAPLRIAELRAARADWPADVLALAAREAFVLQRIAAADGCLRDLYDALRDLGLVPRATCRLFDSAAAVVDDAETVAVSALYAAYLMDPRRAALEVAVAELFVSRLVPRMRAFVAVADGTV